MRTIARSLVITILLALPVLAAPQASPFKAPPDEESRVPRIGLAEFKKALAAGQIVAVDVRDQESYQEGHIPGAILVPLMEIQDRVAVLRKTGKPIVTYCG